MSGIILPLIVLALAAWIIPWLLGKLLPEGVPWLIAIGLLSAASLTVLSAAVFWWLYGKAGDAVLAETPGHFVALAARAALVWAPIMVLSVANLPRGWRNVQW
ncbi:hypothetical protein JSE7799_00614 [Jannaschia seosinensis]|uniref:Uncharacterized protein n=1 Tax=Jannaschia seosinensis TaxID=313367 RepID=A0A0M7B7F4_9RHOB|nr:hypothetical protein [Jannaschia seosinensis]CUH23044.1 hypothetical protein JSE7799_00614 [Jannaschia seosinensis]